MTTPSANPPVWTRSETLATIVAHECIFGHEFEIAFHAPEIAQVALPGQFVEVLFGENYAPLVRRPFSLYRVDRETGACSILYMARGAFTSGLAQKRVGEPLSILGPLGRPFSWPNEANVHHLLIAGGIGAPPIAFLARELCREQRARGEEPGRIAVINAARTQDLLVGMVEFAGLDLTLYAVTDDGSAGRRGIATGLLTELLDELDPDTPIRLYACGPMPMLRAIGEIALARDLSCQLSVETAMPCGIGTCYGCALPVRDPNSEAGFVYARACWDGPVFEARDLLWNLP